MSKSRAIEPCRFIFVVGTPGAGKSFLSKELETILQGNGLECRKYGDYPFLRSLYASDQALGRLDRFRSGGGSGAEFVVIDPSVYDIALKIVYEQVLSPETGQGIVKIVEFARPRYDTAFLYYTLGALSQSVFIHVSTTIDVCLRRNERRRRILEEHKSEVERALRIGSPSGISPLDPDIHFVPLEIMREVYAKDETEDNQRSRDQKLVLSLLPARGYFCLENSHDEKDQFRARILEFVENKVLPLIMHGESYESYYNRRLKEIEESLRLFAPA